MSESSPTFSFSRVLRASLFVASLFVILAGLRAASRVLAPLCVALFMAGILLAPFDWLCRRGLRRRWAAVITVGGALGALGGMTALVMRWQDAISSRWPEHRERFSSAYLWLTDALERMGLPVDEGSFLSNLDIETLSTMGGSALRVLLVIGSVLLLTGFVLSDLLTLPEKLGGQLQRRPKIAKLLASTAERLLIYFRVKTATSAATGVLAGLTCFIAGLELPLMWGMLAYLLNYITTVGSLIAAIMPLALAFVTLDVTHAVGLGLAYLSINIAIGGVLEPKLLGGSMNLSPLVILLSLALWGWILGPIGVLLAVPLTTLLKILFEQTEHLRPVALVLGSRRSARRIRDSDYSSIRVPHPKSMVGRSYDSVVGASVVGDEGDGDDDAQPDVEGPDEPHADGDSEPEAPWPEQAPTTA